MMFFHYLVACSNLVEIPLSLVVFSELTYVGVLGHINGGVLMAD